jgi:hypothetical protein
MVLKPGLVTNIGARFFDTWIFACKVKDIG